MASAKFSAFEFASDEFNSELARLVDVFTKGLVKIISEECVRNGDGGENSENGSNKSSPFSSPKGKAPRKKAAAAPKRGRPSKDETDVVLETVSDMRSVSDELLDRIEVVRNSSASPRDSIPVILDDLLNQQTQSPVSPEEVVEEQPTKKGKAKASKEPKAPKEKVVKEKVAKQPKEKKEKVVKEKVAKQPKEKKEKVAKQPKEKKEKVPKEPKANKGKKGDTSPATEPEEIAKQSTETLAHDDDDNDGLDAEIVNSQTVTVESFDKTDALVASLQTAVSELSEEYDYATVVGAIDGIINILEDVVVSSSHNSQEDEIVIDQDESQEGDKDDMSQPPPEDEDDEDDEDEDIGADEDDVEIDEDDL
jgi:hypothetical protein